MARSISTERTGENSVSAMQTELLRIWLVDDDDTFRTLLAQLLNFEHGVECPLHFSSTEAVLQALQKQTPDAILLDVDMPGMSGVEAIQPIKKLSSSTAVLMLTTFSNHEAKRQSLAAGAAGFLLKNKSPAAIVAAIRAAKELRCPESHLARE
jgi:DNA-binding NarL/FixJ family response regulator